jgi:hypothetical protein
VRHAPKWDETVQVGGDKDVGVLQELTELHRWRSREVWIRVLQNTLLSIWVEIVNYNDAIIATTGAELTLWFEIDIVGAIFMGPGSLLS